VIDAIAKDTKTSFRSLNPRGFWRRIVLIWSQGFLPWKSLLAFISPASGLVRDVGVGHQHYWLIAYYFVGREFWSSRSLAG
jgi:hypothetical protein